MTLDLNLTFMPKILFKRTELTQDQLSVQFSSVQFIHFCLTKAVCVYVPRLKIV